MATTTAPRAKHAKPGALSAARRPAFFGPRLVLALLALLALVGVMLFNGYLRSELGDDDRVRENAPSERVPDRVLNGGSVLAFPNGKPRPRPVPRKTVALTFDDGPDPRVDAEGPRHARRSTTRTRVFFVTGTMTSRYPDLVQRMVDGGPRGRPAHLQPPRPLATSRRSRVDWELSQTQLALAGAAGIRTSLFRPPYSSFADAMDNTVLAGRPSTSAAAATSPSSTTPTARTGSRPGVDEDHRATPRPRAARARSS